MKKVPFYAIMTSLAFMAVSCSSDDNDPEEVLEQEVITTMTITLTPSEGAAVTLQSRDLDGDGPNVPEINVSGPLTPGETYTGTIVLLNETESPAEDITLEVTEKADEHQFFYGVSGGLDVTTEYTSFDSDQNPLGTAFSITTGEVSSGSVLFTLRHEPKKPNDGSLADAGGETDIAVSFDLSIE